MSTWNDETFRQLEVDSKPVEEYLHLDTHSQMDGQVKNIMPLWPMATEA